MTDIIIDALRNVTHPVLLDEAVKAVRVALQNVSDPHSYSCQLCKALPEESCEQFGKPIHSFHEVRKSTALAALRKAIAG